MPPAFSAEYQLCPLSCSEAPVEKFSAGAGEAEGGPSARLAIVEEIKGRGHFVAPSMRDRNSLS